MMKYDAILALHNESNPNTKLLIRGDVEELTDLSIVQSNGKTPSFTWDEVLTKEAELLSEYDAQEYARNRAVAYDSVGDQLDMIMKDMRDGTTTHKDACEAVKAKYPKPE